MFSLIANYYTTFGLEWDTDGFGRIAQNLIQGHGYVFEKGGATVFIRPPIYPLLLSLVYFLSGGVYQTVILLVHSILGALTCIMVYLVGKEVYNRKIGFYCGIVTCLHPLLVWYTGRIFVGTLLTLLLAIMTFCLVKNFKRLHLKYALTVGLLLGVLNLTKGVLLFFPLFILAGFLVISTWRRFFSENLVLTPSRIFKNLFVICLTMVVVTSPWTLRNYLESKKFIPVSVGGGYNFLVGDFFVKYYEEVGEDNKLLIGKAYDEMKVILSQKGFEHPPFFNLSPDQDDYLNRVALEKILKRPSDLVVKVRKQFLRFWCLGASEKKTAGLLILQFPFLVLALVGIFFSLKMKKNFLAPFLVIAYFVLLHSAIFAVARFSVPVVPYVIIFAVFGVQQIHERYFSRLFSYSKQKQQQHFIRDKEGILP